jgi:hypothetical protein
MGRFREQLVEPTDGSAADRRRNVLRRVTQIDWVDLGITFCAQQAGTQRQDAAAVCGSAFWEHADDALGICIYEGGKGDELRFILRNDCGRRECEKNRAEKRDALDFAAVWVRAREDGLEDACEVERIERGRERGGNDRASLRSVLLCF